MSLFFPIILGTARDGGRSDAVARYTERVLREHGADVRLFDVASLPFGNLAAREWEMDPRSPEVDAFVKEMARADGFVLVFPEYNHGYPGALKNVLDHLEDEWQRKPFALVSTGGQSGGLRAAEGLVPVIRGLKAVTVPTSIAVTGIAKAWGEDGPTTDGEAWQRRFHALYADLEWWALALKAARGVKPPG